MKNPEILDTEPIHGWFELTYAQYLTIPRSVLQSMPVEWQQRFVDCLNELDEAIDWRPKDACYWVSLRGDDGKFISIETDPFMDYERGRRQIPLNPNYHPKTAAQTDYQEALQAAKEALIVSKTTLIDYCDGVVETKYIDSALSLIEKAQPWEIKE